MSEFEIGDKVVFAHGGKGRSGIVVAFDCDGDPWVEWSDHSRGDYYNSQLLLYEPGFWSDFQERIKERLF